MIKEDYVSFEIAKLLNEKGFDGECDYYYPEDGGEMQQLLLDELYYHNEDFIKCPTLQMAMKWLREVHKLSIDICIVQGKGISYMFNIWDFSTIHNNKFIGGMFDLREQLYDFLTHEDAVEAALKYSLENLI